MNQVISKDGTVIAFDRSGEGDEDLYPLHEVPRWQWAGEQSDDRSGDG